MGNAKIKIAGHEINIRVDHIKSFKTKDSFLKAQMKDLESLNIPVDTLESALGDTYDIYVPPKVKNDK